MSMLWDCVCARCGYSWDEFLDRRKICSLCPECGSAQTNTAPGGLKSDKAKEPYDLLDGPIPDGKRVFSGPKVKSK